MMRRNNEGIISSSQEPLLIAHFRTYPNEVRIGTQHQIRLLVYSLRTGQDIFEIPRQPCIDGLPQYKDDDPQFQPKMDVLGRSVANLDHVPAISVKWNMGESSARDGIGRNHI